MVDPYAMLIQMATEGKKPEEIAAATGWPIDAVQTLAEEIMSHSEQQPEHA
jgi:hypothetical protein